MKNLCCTSCGASDFYSDTTKWHETVVKCSYCGSEFYDQSLERQPVESPIVAPPFHTYSSGCSLYMVPSYPNHFDSYGLGESNYNPGDYNSPKNSMGGPADDGQKTGILKRIFG